MRLTLAVRRRGGDAEAAVDVLLRAMGLPDDVRAAAVAVRRDRDRVGEGRRVLAWFEGLGGATSRVDSRRCAGFDPFHDTCSRGGVRTCGGRV
jgi:hypothetical protein